MTSYEAIVRNRDEWRTKNRVSTMPPFWKRQTQTEKKQSNRRTVAPPQQMMYYPVDIIDVSDLEAVSPLVSQSPWSLGEKDVEADNVADGNGYRPYQRLDDPRSNLPKKSLDLDNALATLEGRNTHPRVDSTEPDSKPNDITAMPRGTHQDLASRRNTQWRAPIPARDWVPQTTVIPNPFKEEAPAAASQPPPQQHEAPVKAKRGLRKKISMGFKKMFKPPGSDPATTAGHLGDHPVAEHSEAPDAYHQIADEHRPDSGVIVQPKAPAQQQRTPIRVKRMTMLW